MAATVGCPGCEEYMMHTTLTARILTAALLAGGACLAQAAPPADTALPSYTQLDKDKDGIVTMAEMDVYPPGVAARLHHCDTDKNHQLSQPEYAQCTAGAHAPMPAQSMPGPTHPVH